jgi:hypothetical protein
MNDLLYERWVAGVLSAALFVSFILCVASDLRFSVTLKDAGVVLPASAGIIALGISWLLGHGLHGAAVFAVPMFFLTRNKAAAVEAGEEAN